MKRMCRVILAVVGFVVVAGGARGYVADEVANAAPVREAVAVGSEAARPQARPEFADEFEAELDGSSSAGFPDPLESINRRTLAFNQGVDRWVLDPVTTVYRLVLPGAARKSIMRFLTNLDSPAVFANDLMQREWHDAGVTVWRFGINSTFGMAGLFDPASVLVEGHTSDFGQTLALEGVPSGAYLVVPLFGPSTVRDGLGEIVDVFLRPITLFLGPIDQIFYATIYGGSSGIALHDAHGDELEMLEQSSVDFYAALRNAYYQNRTAEIWGRRGDHDSLATVAMNYWSPPPDGAEVHAASR
jgi:phospholipid-binding lipoprotein MlaA